ncbi:MAG TPA: YfhO family protein [Thermoanaerobaculia bacterium]
MRPEGAPSNRGAERLATVLAGAALALVAALAFWPVVSGERSFFQMDLRYEHVPIWHAVQQALRSGESPFWIDGQYCGNPLLFTQEAPPFYPLTAPLLLTGAPAHRASDLFSLFHLWLAGFAAFLLLRGVGSVFPAAVFGGVAWMLSARMVQSAIWPNAVAVAALLPLVLLGIFRIACGQHRSGVIVAAISGGLCFLAARPHVLVGAAPLLLVAGGTAVLFSRRPARAIGDLTLAALLAVALGAPSLFPAAVLYPETSRAGGLARADRDFASFSTAGEVDQVFLPVDGPRRWPEAAAYPGFLVAFLFALGAILSLRRGNSFPHGLFVAAAAGGAIGLLFAFGEKGPLGLIADLPLLRGFRIPARYLTSWSLGLALGSALVLSELLRRSRHPSRIAAVCLVGLTADLVLHARRAAPTAPSAIYSTEPAVVSALRPTLEKDDAGFPRRVWSLAGPALPWFFDDEEKITIARRFEPLYGAIGMTSGLEMVGGAGPSMERWKSLFQSVSDRPAELASVGALILPAPASGRESPGMPRFVVRRFSGLPRAFVVPEAVVVPRSRAKSAALDERLDPRRTVVLEEGNPLAAEPLWASQSGSARLLSRAPGRLKLAASLPGNGVLVVLNTFEKGWKATADGRPRPVVAADAAFQGVRLPRGEHVVELRYRPRGLATGIAAAGIGVLGLVLCAFRPADG